MAACSTSAAARHGKGHTQGWFMRLLGFLSRRTARPAFLYPGELSPHLRRDLGLADIDGACRPPRT